MILQFGSGNFLRAFVDLFASEIQGFPGPVMVVQSTGKEKADALNKAKGKYHVAVQGYGEEAVFDVTICVESIGRAYHAGSEWEEVLDLGRRAELLGVVSNTTEAGISLDPEDNDPSANPPRSFPAKLLTVLSARWDAGLPGLWIAPCELIESNAHRLRDLVLEQANRWELSVDFVTWLREECQWINTLVDRIVPGPPKEHPLLGKDPLLIGAEPFALWAVETEDSSFPFSEHPAVVLCPDIRPFSLRKVRILNGAHTALVCRTKGTGITTVREAVEDLEVGAWLEEFLFTEVVPILEGRCEDPAGFVRSTLDRFRNPFLEHKLSSIALNHEAKIQTRLIPTREDYRKLFGASPPLLDAMLETV